MYLLPLFSVGSNFKGEQYDDLRNKVTFIGFAREIAFLEGNKQKVNFSAEFVDQESTVKKQKNKKKTSTITKRERERVVSYAFSFQCFSFTEMEKFQNE